MEEPTVDRRALARAGADWSAVDSRELPQIYSMPGEHSFVCAGPKEWLGLHIYIKLETADQVRGEAHIFTTRPFQNECDRMLAWTAIRDRGMELRATELPEFPVQWP